MKQGSCVKENSADELFGQLTFMGVRMSKDNITEEFCSVFFSFADTCICKNTCVGKKEKNKARKYSKTY